MVDQSETQSDWRKALARTRLLPVIIIRDTNDALPMATAFLEAGVDVMEIPLRTPAALNAVERIADALPEMHIGAGTVLRTGQIDDVIAAGGKFGVAAGLNEEVVVHARRRGLDFVPGVATPTEVEHAYALGCGLLKFFPAEPLGGAETLAALAGPYGHLGIEFIPLGGVRPHNAKAYASLNIVAAIGGSWLAPPEDIENGRWREISRRAREALQVIGAGS